VTIADIVTTLDHPITSRSFGRRRLPGTEQALAEGRATLTEVESKELLAHAGIRVPRGGCAADAAQAGMIAARLGCPTVVKVVSPDLPHKSDVGGVYLGASGPDATRQAATEVLANVQRARPDARVMGILVEEQFVGGVECVAGLVGRSILGPAVMFGLGGIFTELVDDVAFRLAPLRERDAREMIDEIRGSELLAGYRGRPAVDRAALEQTLIRLGELAASGAIAELDINPLLALPSGAVALDAFVTLACPNQ
jgi:succinyl-CoA synthetase beta subunit